MSHLYDSTSKNVAIEAGVPVLRSVVLDSHKIDIRRMKDAGYIADWNGFFLACHTKAFAILGRPGYETKSPGNNPLEQNALAYPQPDGSWIVCRLGTRAEAEAGNWYANSEGYATARVPSPTPTIDVSGEETDVIDKAVHALASVNGVYQRGGVLTRVTRNSPVPLYILRAPDAPHIEPLPTAALREALSSAARYERFDGRAKKMVRCGVPTWLVQAVEARKSWSVPTIEAVTEVPLFISDGTILDRPGFDEPTGTYYEPATEFNGLPSVKDAVAMLLAIVTDFPFATPAHRAGWIAAVLTPLARLAFQGPSPFFLFEANRAGVGKGLGLSVTALIALGRDMSRMSAPEGDDNEWRKRITSIAVEGEPAVLIDNISGTLKSASLDAVLTSTSWSDRLLGGNQIVRAPLTTVFYGSGNNLVLARDTVRRTCHIRLESPHEKPEERGGFVYPDLLAHVKQVRGRLTMAALSILRHYHLAGRPDMGLVPWGSFEGWSALIRNAIVWAGLPDPAEVRAELAAKNDDDSGLLAMLLSGWQEADPQGTGLTVQEALNKVAVGQCPTLLAAVVNFPAERQNMH